MQGGDEAVRELEEAQSSIESNEQPAEQPTEDNTETKDIETPDSTESARDTVARVIEQTKNETLGDEAKEKSLEKAPTEKGRRSKKDSGVDNGIPAPNRFTAAEKEIFNSAPPKLKAALAKMVDDHQAHFSQLSEQYARAAHEAKSIMEAVQPFAAKWGERGFTVPAALVSLAAAQEKLTNPDTALDTYIRLGHDVLGGLGMDFDQLAAAAKGEKQQTKAASIANDPQFQQLQSELNSIKSYQEQVQSAQRNAVVNSIVSEIEAVQDEKDQYGRYKYPRMHDEGFFAQVRPLVSALAQTLPGVSYGELVKRAYTMVDNSGNPAQVNQTRPHQQQATQRIPTGVSVRGKSSSAVSNGVMLNNNIPKSAKDTVAMVLEQLRRGT